MMSINKGSREPIITLRMFESEIINRDPKEIIAAGTDWHFNNELKRELKT